MAVDFILPLRAAQGVLALLLLGLTAYAASDWADGVWSPSDLNFNVFASVWTLLVLAYLVVAPLRFPKFAHKFGILAADAITMIFWFAGFIALAVMVNNWGCKHYGPCRAAIAASVFGAIEWLLFVASTVMAALHVMRTRHSHSGTHDPGMEVHPNVGT
ncbi:hypothetical protein P152DRAFT_461564 [Eremomyces bilateralis CBS 781.70]|uniref:MARVEL domain-containing protein n=1 Tax=Eremomyces bilateralis CBS 781.70 TaxID=1392243 RepID=A0A6G1FU99_9PEZI|nr:uncharacterized protein P152DRAFT_461564 [Eremomyces bilateralis CBS 781.70]KAF1809377.1 hypothetical protein P152DRAFT_461564 [Eremomyces bilateralis CBS 781.70]